MLAIWIAVLVLVGLTAAAVFKAHLYICPPNEVMVFSGRRRVLEDGTELGYRVVKGGRGWRFPLIEAVSRMPLTTLPIEIELRGALTNGTIPVNIKATATVKIAGSEAEGLLNALERFLGRSVTEIAQVARENLEGSLRGVLATLTPEEANSQRLHFAQRVVEEARADLRNLGLVLDTLKIKDLSDEQGYLEAIGRKKNAEIQRDARIAEANAEAEARVVASEAEQTGSVAEKQAQMRILDAENARRVHAAQLEERALAEEAKAEVGGELARVKEQHELEKERVKMNRQKFEADVIIPARAEKEAMELRAAGESALILEEGKATAEAVAHMRKDWVRDETRELYLIQQLPSMIDKVTRVISDNMSIDKVTILDGSSGNGIPNYVSNIAGSVVSVFEQISNATGLDIPDLLRRNRGQP